MNQQLDEVWQQVLEFKLDIKDVKSKGLYKIKPDDREKRVANIESMFSKLGAY